MGARCQWRAVFEKAKSYKVGKNDGVVNDEIGNHVYTLAACVLKKQFKYLLCVFVVIDC